MYTNTFEGLSIPTPSPSSHNEPSPSLPESPTAYYIQQLSTSNEMDDNSYVHPGAHQMRHSLSRDSNLPEDRRSVATPSSSVAYTHDIPTTYASVRL